MTALTNRTRAGGFMVSEANWARSREKVTIAGGTGGAGIVYAGTVLGKLTSGGKYVPSPNTGSDGSQTAVAILWEDVDATDADVVASVIRRDAEVRASDLTYDSTVNDDTKKGSKHTQLAAAGVNIIVRVSDDAQST